MIPSVGLLNFFYRFLVMKYFVFEYRDLSIILKHLQNDILTCFFINPSHYQTGIGHTISQPIVDSPYTARDHSVSPAEISPFDT